MESKAITKEYLKAYNLTDTQTSFIDDLLNGAVIPVLHIKSQKCYIATELAINTTNSGNEVLMVVYQSPDHTDVFTRELVEFFEKFKYRS